MEQSHHTLFQGIKIAVSLLTIILLGVYPIFDDKTEGTKGNAGYSSGYVLLS
jgi:hypothetical protein